MSSLTGCFENEWKVISSRQEINCLPLYLFSSEERRIRTNYRGSSKHLNSIARSYSLNPVCSVTVCRQVRCMHWGYLGFFHKDISFKLTRNGLYERFNLYIYLYQICVYVFYVFENVVYMHINFNLEPHWVWCLCIHINGGLKPWLQYAETWPFFKMFTPNWPPGKYIRDLSYYQQYIGLHRYHIIPYIET